ncbi:MAG: rhomboid family intramembrane serine protease [Candidatus Omnitrophica bacterium]|nr:hypothetical protein [bacterium]NUN96033.1 rhomboid family intramembrane serine protease [Candidatus Omnitrophota bacterium]
MCLTPPIPIAFSEPLSSPPRLTYALLGINGAVFVFFRVLIVAGMLGFVSTELPEKIVHWVGYIDSRRDPWTYLTASFCHVEFLHLLGNLLFLWMFGSYVEDRLGLWPYGFLVLGGALFGSIGHSVSLEMTHAVADMQKPAIGASDIVAAILGAHLILNPGLETKFFSVLIWIPFRVIPLTWSMPAIFYIPCWIAMESYSAYSVGSSAGVAHAAHLGGVAYGVVFGIACRLLPKTGWAAKRRIREEEERALRLAETEYANFQDALSKGAAEFALHLFRREERGQPPLPVTPTEKLTLAHQLRERGEHFVAAKLYREMLADESNPEFRLEAGLRLAEITLDREHDIEGAKRLLRVLHQRYKAHPGYPEVHALIERVKRAERNLFKRPS